ncbi:MAG TPA: DUF6748 domain-containing protein [Polyangiales bacterium]|nr:DUF6748 domain-containing protein [Polyangiales bacterium]
MHARIRLPAISRWLTATTLAISACAFAPPALAQAPDSAETSTFLIVTRQDTRRCAYPLCGGYFVKRVNHRLTRCADGAWRTECHAVDLDFSATGLTPEQSSSFEGTFGAGLGLVRGELEQRDVGAASPADTLVVSGAWEGQGPNRPSGDFFRLTSTGILCITFPCPSFSGALLNTQRTRTFNSVDLGAAGAPDEAVDLAYQAIDGGVLAAGRTVRIVGPAGRGFDFVASQFYVRLVPKETPCAAMDATGIGPCDAFLGWAWDGAACAGISGCSCEGADCAALHPSYEECNEAHAGCTGALCGSRGLPPCADGDYCDFPADSQCGAADEPGVCLPRPEACILIYDPVCGCDGLTHGSGCQAASAGTDVAYDGECSP